MFDKLKRTKFLKISAKSFLCINASEIGLMTPKICHFFCQFNHHFYCPHWYLPCGEFKGKVTNTISNFRGLDLKGVFRI